MSSSDLYTSGDYLRNNPDWHAADAPWKADRMMALLRDHRVTPGSVAEVGCGAGAVLAAMAERLPDAARLEGWDISPQAIELARARSAERTRFHVGSPAPGDGPFDLLLLVDVIEHVEDPFGFLRGLHGVGRRTLAHVPLDLSVQSVARADRLMRSRRDVGHLHYFTKETALALFEDAGYRVLDWRYTAGTLDLPVRSLAARLARLPRRLLRAANADLAARLLGGFSLLVLAE